MKKRLTFCLVLVGLFLAAAAYLPDAADITWWNIGGGGEPVSQGSLALDGITGQGVIEMVSQPGMELCSGYYCFQAPLRVYLPLVRR